METVENFENLASFTYKCDICDKTLMRKASLKAHQRIHAGEKTFDCDIVVKISLNQVHFCIISSNNILMRNHINVTFV